MGKKKKEKGQGPEKRKKGTGRANKPDQGSSLGTRAGRKKKKREAGISREKQGERVGDV